MRLDPAIFAELAVPYEFEHFVRVMPAAHKTAALEAYSMVAPLWQIRFLCTQSTPNRRVSNMRLSLEAMVLSRLF